MVCVFVFMCCVIHVFIGCVHMCVYVFLCPKSNSSLVVVINHLIYQSYRAPYIFHHCAGHWGSETSDIVSDI